MNFKNLNKMITPQNMLILAFVVIIICIVVFKTKESFKNKNKKKRRKNWKPGYGKCKRVDEKALICKKAGMKNL